MDIIPVWNSSDETTTVYAIRGSLQSSYVSHACHLVCMYVHICRTATGASIVLVVGRKQQKLQRVTQASLDTSMLKRYAATTRACVQG